MEGKIHSIETFGSVDGPGIRFILFLQGCSMRCKYCHNVDTWNMANADKKMTAKEVLNMAKRYRPYWKETGGITVSGGEPLLQIDFLIELFKLAHEEGINTCIDTSGQPFTKEEPFFSKFEELMKYTDLLLVDIKHINEDEHIKLTERSGINIKEMLRYLSDVKKPIWIRHVLVPGITDVDKYLNETKSFINSLENVEKVEVLPFHKMGEYKWKELGIKYDLDDVEPPTKERLEKARNNLCKV